MDILLVVSRGENRGFHLPTFVKQKFTERIARFTAESGLEVGLFQPKTAIFYLHIIHVIYFRSKVLPLKSAELTLAPKGNVVIESGWTMLISINIRPMIMLSTTSPNSNVLLNVFVVKASLADIVTLPSTNVPETMSAVNTKCVSL